jgi:hypothetical protein
MALALVVLLGCNNSSHHRIINQNSVEDALFSGWGLILLCSLMQWQQDASKAATLQR